MEVVDCNIAVVDKFDDSVVLIEYKDSDSISVKDLSGVEQSVGQLIGNHAYFAISVLTKCFKNFTFEAKNFITDENQKLANREIDCYVADSLSKRLQLEMFFQMHKPTRKTKVFSSLNKALTYVTNKKKLEVDKTGVLV